MLWKSADYTGYVKTCNTHFLLYFTFPFCLFIMLFCVSDCSYQRQRDYWVARAQDILSVVNIHLHQRCMLSQGQVLNDNSQELILKAFFWCTLQCRVYVCPLWVDIKWQTLFHIWKILHLEKFHTLKISHFKNFTLGKFFIFHLALPKTLPKYAKNLKGGRRLCPIFHFWLETLWTIPGTEN